MTQQVMDWHDLSVGDQFFEDTYDEIYEVVETGCFENKYPGVKVVVVGSLTGKLEVPPRETQEPEFIYGDLGGPWSGQPYYRVK